MKKLVKIKKYTRANGNYYYEVYTAVRIFWGLITFYSALVDGWDDTKRYTLAGALEEEINILEGLEEQANNKIIREEWLT